MKQLSKFNVIEETYSYENHDEKLAHIKTMQFMGYSTVSKPYTASDLVITYQIRKLIDNIARL